MDGDLHPGASAIVQTSLTKRGAVGTLQASGAPRRGQKPAERDGSPWACPLLPADLLSLDQP